MTISIGQTIDSRYRIDQEIAIGGMGTVYKATDLRLGKAVALKLLAAHYTYDTDFLSPFRQEARTMAMLEHLHIVQVTDFAEQPGMCYLVMELISGGSISRLLKPYRDSGQQLPERSAIELCRQTAEGLAYAHSKGVIHRDIKPDNLLFVKVQGANGTVSRMVKIADFGIVQLRQSLPGAQHHTVRGSFIGTLSYAPLEQLEGRSLDERSDIYALGAVFYELLTGAPTMTFAPTETDHQRFIKALDLQRAERIAPARALRGDLSLASLGILEACLASDPARRFGSAAELAGALELAMRGANTTRTPANPTVAPAPATVHARPNAPNQLIPPTFRQTASALASPRVRVREATGQERFFDLTAAGLTVGRMADNQLALNDQSASARHLRIDWDGAQASVTDLGSRNGTSINSRLIPAHTPTPWQTSLQVGDSFFQLEQPTSGTQPMARPGLTVAMLQQLQAGAALAIDIEPSGQVLAVIPGQPQPFTVLLAKAGQHGDSVAISVEGIPATCIQGLPTAPVVLSPSNNNQAMFPLTAIVPRTAASVAGNYSVIFRATSISNALTVAVAKITISLQPFEETELVLAPKRSQGVSSGRHTITVRNNGNTAQTYGLSAKDVSDALDCRLGNSTVVVNPGASCDVSLVMTPKRQQPQTYLHSFVIVAKPDGGAALSEQGEFVQEAAVAQGVQPAPQHAASQTPSRSRGSGWAILLVYLFLFAAIIAISREYNARTSVVVPTIEFQPTIASYPATSTPSFNIAFDELNAELVDLRFFETGINIPSFGDRTYQTVFLKGGVRCINYELWLKHRVPAERVNFTINSRWYKPNGSLMSSYPINTYVLSGWNDSVHTDNCSSDAIGDWDRGEYRVELYINDSKIARGSFTVK